MWELARNSVGLFIRGKLFADPVKVFRQVLIGIVVTALLLIGAVKAGAPLLVAVLAAASIGGALQPFLFRSLRYL
jgi:hypothetical protein